ncbi:SRPBCC family protein [Methylomagnum sp.]
MDIFLYAALMVVASGMVALLIGRRLPKTHLAVSRIRLNAPPEQVFAIVSDFESYPTWRPGLDRVERGPDIDGLPSWFEVCAKISRVQFHVVESQPPKRLATRIVDDKLTLSGLWIYDFQASDDGTLLTITERENIHHPLLRFFDRFVLSYHGVMDVYLMALARKLGDPTQPEHLSLKLGDDGPAP